MGFHLKVLVQTLEGVGFRDWEVENGYFFSFDLLMTVLAKGHSVSQTYSLSRIQNFQLQVLLLDEVTIDLDVVARMDLLEFFKEECDQV